MYNWMAIHSKIFPVRTYSVYVPNQCVIPLMVIDKTDCRNTANVSTVNDNFRK